MTVTEARALINTAIDLRDLRDRLDRIDEELDPEDRADMDLSDLPTFGGTEPETIAVVYSWDAIHILGYDFDNGGWIIEPRTDPPDPVEQQTCAVCGTTAGRIEGDPLVSGRPTCDACHDQMEAAAAAKEEKMMICPGAAYCGVVPCGHREPHAETDSCERECYSAMTPYVCQPVSEEEE